MAVRLVSWKTIADAVWAATDFSHPAAAKLAAEIVHDGSGALTGLARQALPSLKVAAGEKADAYRRTVARRRFGLLRDELHALARPGFGRRHQIDGVRPETADPFAAERRLLGLPLAGRLTGPEIVRAFRVAAKAAHPDRGGQVAAFAGIVRARDVLLGRSAPGT